MRVQTRWVMEPTVEKGPSEDACVIQADQPVPILVVSDGHGREYDQTGYRLDASVTVGRFAGRVAEQLAIGACLYREAIPFETLFQEVSEQIDPWRDARVGEGEVGVRSVGASVSLVAIIEDQLHLAQAGDCRLYRMDQRGLTQLSTDHSPGSRLERKRLAPLIAQGVVHRARIRGHWRLMVEGSSSAIAVSRGFGDWRFAPALTCEPEVRVFDLDPEATYILCSDGANSFIESLFSAAGLYLHDLDDLVTHFRDHVVWPNDDVTAIFFRAGAPA